MTKEPYLITLRKDCIVVSAVLESEQDIHDLYFALDHAITAFAVAESETPKGGQHDQHS